MMHSHGCVYDEQLKKVWFLEEPSIETQKKWQRLVQITGDPCKADWNNPDIFDYRIIGSPLESNADFKNQFDSTDKIERWVSIQEQKIPFELLIKGQVRFKLERAMKG